MAFQNFTFPQVEQALGLTLSDEDLFSQLPAIIVRPEFFAQVIEGANLASAINTEKARSEFVIAPVLFELRRLHVGHLGLFSGIELDADASRGLNGVCDFVITKSPRQHIVSAPLITIIEAKNDNLRSGLGQCIAAMCAAQLLNQAASASIAAVYGAVTTGSLWKFLRLRGYGSHARSGRVPYRQPGEDPGDPRPHRGDRLIFPLTSPCRVAVRARCTHTRLPRPGRAADPPAFADRTPPRRAGLACRRAPPDTPRSPADTCRAV